ncbi:hypothetical protein KDN24_24970 [Bacillus sp. Bva_UNVM-123]|uniref:hypothetical protein n=1 Tax=Bacillus sp. Bva_UNVM-123 TaxID=2829798 RepID=UPI00391F1E55
MIKILLPIFIIFILIIIPIVFVKKNKVNKRVTIKTTHWLFYLYFSILLLSACFASFFVNDIVEGRKVSSETEIHAKKYEFRKALNEGKIETIASENLLKLSSFPYEKSALKISYEGPGYSDLYVERKKVDDGTIEAYVFANGLIVGGYDFTDQLQPLNFAVSEVDEQLTISSSMERKELKIALMKKEFPINQFYDQTKFFDINIHDEPVVYLRIPKDVHVVENEELSLNYVGGIR